MDTPCWRCGSRLSCRHRKASDAPLIVFCDHPPTATFHLAFAKATQSKSRDEIFRRLADQLRPLGR